MISIDKNIINENDNIIKDHNITYGTLSFLYTSSSMLFIYMQNIASKKNNDNINITLYISFN